MSSGILSQAQLAALGAIVAESAELESSVDLFLTVILNMAPEHYEILIKQQPLAAKLGHMKTIGLTKLKSKKNKSALGKIMDRLIALNHNRNVVVHGKWEPNDGYMLAWIASGVPPGTKVRAVDAKQRTFQADQLQETANKIRIARAELFNFWIKHRIRPAGRRSARREAAKADVK